MSANSFVWYELMTSDLDAARAFYGSVVGWSVNRFQDSDPPYFLASPPGASMPAAGLMGLPEEARANGGRPGWIGYVGVADADSATEKVRAAGGAVRRAPADIPNIGRFSVVADPHGAVFCLFQPFGRDEGGSAQNGAPGRIGWCELYAGDGPAAFDWYAGQFGWTKDQAMDMGPMGVYQLFAVNGVAVGGIMTKPPQVPAAHWLFYFNVDEINAAVDRVKAAGGQVLNGPMEVPGGSWICQCMDPQGAAFALVAPPPAQR